MLVQRIIASLILIAVFGFMFNMILLPYTGGITYTIHQWRAYRRQRGRPIPETGEPRGQMHMPHAYGWWYVEFLPSEALPAGGTTGLCTFSYARGHAANWPNEALVRRHSQAPWWSWFRRPPCVLDYSALQNS